LVSRRVEPVRSVGDGARGSIERLFPAKVRYFGREVQADTELLWRHGSNSECLLRRRMFGSRHGFPIGKLVSVVA